QTHRHTYTFRHTHTTHTHHTLKGGSIGMTLSEEPLSLSKYGSYLWENGGLRHREYRFMSCREHKKENEPDHFSPPVSVLNYCYIYNRRSNTRRDSTMNVFGLLV